MERTLENAQIAGVIGDMSNNYCYNQKTNVIYPNPCTAYATLTITSESNHTYEIFIETAIVSDLVLDSLTSHNQPSPISIRQHESYFRKSLISGEVKAGNNVLQLDINQFGTGIYYISYEGSDGYSDCYPLVVQRFEW